MTAPVPVDLGAARMQRASALPPPHHLDVEASVLSAVVLGEVALADLHPLAEKHLYAPAHQRIYRALVAMEAEGAAVDLTTLAGRLREMGYLADVGGMGGLTRLVEESASVATLAECVRLLVDAWARREAGKICLDAAGQARHLGSDTASFLAGVRQQIEAVEEERGTSEPATDLATGFVTDLQTTIDAANEQAGTLCCPTGFAGLDMVMQGGWWRQKLVIVGARPGCGKTATGIQACVTCAVTPPEQGGGGALFLSVELDGKQARQRFVSHETGLTMGEVLAARPETEAQRVEAMAFLGSLPLWLDAHSKKVTAIRASVRRHRRLAEIRGVPLRLVVIDYLQVIQTDAGPMTTREQQVAQVSRDLLRLRAECPDATLLVLAQLKREAVGRRPTDSDIKESGQVEQDADTVALLYRPAEDDKHRVCMTFPKNRGLRQDLDLDFALTPMVGRLVEVSP